jgi:hypothetical protein
LQPGVVESFFRKCNAARRGVDRKRFGRQDFVVDIDLVERPPPDLDDTTDGRRIGETPRIGGGSKR